MNFNDYAGLFGTVSGSGRVRNVGLINAHVTSTAVTSRSVGALVGNLESNGVVETSYVQGGRIVTTGGGGVGDTGWVGGLIGSTSRATIRACWANVTVTATKSPRVRLGGLVGGVNGAVIDSYAYGPVVNTASGNTRGGLIGNGGADGSAENSYCNLAAGLQSACMGNRSSFFTGNVTARTAAQLQAPIDYTGIYANWNRDLDGDSQPDNPWFFGTASQYPTLLTPAQRQATIPGNNDHDANNNGLIEITTLAQLNAIRYDLDGDGRAPGHTTSYALAFPNRNTTSTELMGCPSGNCAGYELAASLTFPSETSSPYNPWTPVDGTYNAVFDGQGHTLTDLNIYVPPIDAPGGLFENLGGSSTVRDLGIINGTLLSASQNSQNNGLLAGRVSDGGVVTAVYADGGSVTFSTSGSGGGGLVGRLNGTLRAAWSTASVTATGTASNVDVGGLIGARRGGTLIAGFAAGAVTSSPGGTVNAIGGLIGGSYQSGGGIVNSYCDREAGGQADCIGSQTGTPVTANALTTAELQSPTGYTGIYIHWNLDLDGDGNPDYPYDFGAANEYPTLNTPAQRANAAPAPMDYDANDNNLIDVSNLDQLHALRWDLDGDGDPDSNAIAYSTVFPGRSTSTPGRMGCPGTCAGYELTRPADLPVQHVQPLQPLDPDRRPTQHHL